ncbi:MAG: CADD family putative folate metabolism protein [Cyanobacteria bacterium P01_E01_bin.48]
MPMTLREKLHTLIDRKHLLTHPFYQAWTAGKLTQEQLRHYAVQYFHNVRAFPTYVSAVHFNTPDLALRQELLENLIEEERGDRNHPYLWKQFALSLGATEAELDNVNPLPQTHNLVDTFRHLCVTSPYYAGLAALYAYESQIPAVANVKVEGLKEFYGLTDPRSYEFFTVHAGADEIHSEVEMQAIAKHADTPEAEAEVLAAADAAATALWQFLDGIYETYCQELQAA